MNKESAVSTEENKGAKAIKVFVFLLILAFYGSLLVHKIELHDGEDMGRHLKNGEMILSGHFEVLYTNVYSYTAPDFPFINHHWLSGVVFFLVHQLAGWGGLIVFKVIILLAAFTLLFLTALKRADFWPVALFAIPAVYILAERTNIRPEVFSYLFAATSLYLLADLEGRPERKRIYWLIPLQLVWVNLHIFFLVGILLVGGFLFEKVIIYRKNLKNNPLIKKLCIVFVAVVAVSFVNPNGWAGFLQPFQIFNNYGITLSENQSIAELLKSGLPLNDISITIFMFTVPLFLLSFLLRIKKTSLFYFSAAISTSILGFSISRTIPFFGLIFLPAVAMNVNDLFCGMRDRLRQTFTLGGTIFSKILAAVFIGALLALIVFGVSGKTFSYKKLGIGLEPNMADAALFLKAHGLKGPLFNDYDIGSYLVYYFFPEEKVFLENRPEAYPISFFNDTYRPMMEDPALWQKLSKQYRFNVIFFHLYDQGWYVGPFLYTRTRDPDWALVYVDRYSIIFVRNTNENEDVVRQFHVTSENAQERLNHMVKSPDFEDRLAAADMFALLGRTDLAEATFLDVVSQWPDKGKVWMVMGQEWQLVNNSKERSLLAVMFLDRAITLGWRSAETYTFLGSAYIDIGQPERAKEALLHALKIDPERVDAKNLMAGLE